MVINILTVVHTVILESGLVKGKIAGVHLSKHPHVRLNFALTEGIFISGRVSEHLTLPLDPILRYSVSVHRTKIVPY